MTDSIGLYIHIPFCAAKCGYCDFLSFDDKESLWAPYKDALLNEVAVEGPVETIYIGGGTPTIWPADYLAELLATLPKAEEITCEANPGTLTQEKIKSLSKGGVNRISLGLQAWQPRLLDAVGRKSGNFIENFHALRQAKFSNISVDIMFGLPGQTMADWEETLQKIVQLGPEHISAYALTPEVVDDKVDRQMYHKCKEFLHDQGYKQYEISNFCKPGYESRHNLRYWLRKPYLGFGLGAHSFNNSARWNNTCDISRYIKGNAIENFAKISEKEAESEAIILGLRMTEGVTIRDEWVDWDAWIEKMAGDGLLYKKNNRIALTDRGMDLANLVMSGFLE